MTGKYDVVDDISVRELYDKTNYNQLQTEGVGTGRTPLMLQFAV
jgi:hypothetical protein